MEQICKIKTQLQDYLNNLEKAQTFPGERSKKVRNGGGEAIKKCLQIKRQLGDIQVFKDLF